MTATTIITDGIATVDGRIDGDRLLIDAESLPVAVGWELKPEGLCRDEVCVPVRDRERLIVDGHVDVGAIAGALSRPFVADADRAVGALALPSEERRRALRERHAPSFTLPDLDGSPHSLEEWRDRKKLLVAFSTW